MFSLLNSFLIQLRFFFLRQIFCYFLIFLNNYCRFRSRRFQVNRFIRIEFMFDFFLMNFWHDKIFWFIFKGIILNVFYCLFHQILLFQRRFVLFVCLLNNFFRTLTFHALNFIMVLAFISNLLDLRLVIEMFMMLTFLLVSFLFTLFKFRLRELIFIRPGKNLEHWGFSCSWFWWKTASKNWIIWHKYQLKWNYKNQTNIFYSTTYRIKNISIRSLLNKTQRKKN